MSFSNIILLLLKPLLLSKNVALRVTHNFSVKAFNLAGPETARPKKVPVPKITLISTDNISVTTLEDAQKLSKRRDLKLVKILDLDTKTQRPVYKLMTGSEYHAEDLKQRELRKKERENTNIKGEKVLLLNANISEHDLNTQSNKVQKWLAKRYEVHVAINGEAEKSEKIFGFLEENVKGVVRILQKRQKGNDTKFQIMPNKKDGGKDHENPKKFMTSCHCTNMH